MIERTLKRVEWCDEIIIVDSGSTDKTLEICKKYTKKIFYRDFDGYGSQKHFAVEKTSNNWVLSVDADEVLSNELIAEMKNIFRQKEISFVGFEVPFSTAFMGKQLKFGSTRNEKHLRLFNKTYGNFNLDKVHEKIILKGKTSCLKQKIEHYTYKDLKDFFAKMNNYSTLIAEKYYKNGKKESYIKAYFKFPFSFLQSYVLRLGILDGFAGFVWAIFFAFYHSVKYIKLVELYKVIVR